MHLKACPPSSRNVPPGSRAADVEPIPDEESRTYWEGVRAHRLIVQRCPACARTRFPPMPSCPACGAPGGDDIDSAGSGGVYSFVRVHRALSPEHAEDVPYTVVVVDLDEGCRVLGRIDGHEPAVIGDRVVATFADHGTWTELRFRAAP
jgi:uncharacterized OB-fold protein